MTRRYSRQIVFKAIGEGGQQRISAARVAIVGCGALGTSSSEMLARAGVGHLTLIDRDLVEESNLQRQALFSEADARAGIPKAIAAQSALRRINETLSIEAHVLELTGSNIRSALGSAHLILDGTDNFSARYLLNEYSVDRGIPWIFASCLGSRGSVCTFLPGAGFCLRCLLGPRPMAGQSATCATEGILAPAARVASSLQVAQALKLLVGESPAARFFSFDLWEDVQTQAPISSQQAKPCPTCQEKKFEFLDSGQTVRLRRLCGDESIQVWRCGDAFDYSGVRKRLLARASVQETEYMLRLSVEDCEITLFRDGRSIIRGAGTPDRARSLYADYIGY